MTEADRHVRESAAPGVCVVLGGERTDLKGFVYPPTPLRGVARGMPAFDDEVLGQAAAAVEARLVEDAIRTSKDSRCGLSASLWTADVEGDIDLARELDVGFVLFNGGIRSDPRLPSGM